MDYEGWIERERRLRHKILSSSPVICREHIYRVCDDCSEVLLCHEEQCPNCNSVNIGKKQLEYADENALEDRIRCKYRFSKLEKEQNGN